MSKPTLNAFLDQLRQVHTDEVHKYERAHIIVDCLRMIEIDQRTNKDAQQIMMSFKQYLTDQLKHIAKNE